MSEKAITNPGGAFGVTDAQQKFWYKSAPFSASVACAARQVVYLSTDGSVAPATTSHILGQVIGVALNAIAVGQIGDVIVGGYAAGVAASAGISAGNLLKATTAGAVAATATPAVGEGIGFAVTDSASSLVDVWVAKRF